MMSYKHMERRLAVMEQKAAQAAEQAYMKWVENLSVADLAALVAADAERDPVGYAAMEAMSDAELGHLIATGRMSAREWETALLQGKERLAAIHASQEQRG